MVNISMESEEKKNLVKWLNALIAMAQWDTSLPFYFARLLNQPEEDSKEYTKALQLIRELPRKIPPPDSPGATLNQKEWQTLYEKTTSVATLRDLFADNNPFENAAPSQISVLAEISDLTTTSDPQTWFYSQNGAFHLVLAAVRLAAARQSQTGEDSEVNMKSLIGDAFGKFYTVFDTNPVITEDLYKLACSNDWYPVLASLKDVADYTTEGTETRATLEAWNKRLIVPDLRKLVLKLFDVPRKLVKLAWERRTLFDEALDLITRESEPGLVTRNQRTELREQVSNAAHKIFVEKAQTEVDEIETDLKLLEVIAKHYISARKFVKLDGLVYLWPRIASLAMANYTSLQYVEDLLVNSKSTPSDSELELNDARELYELCANNRSVVRFLKLHPRFKEIDPNELRRYRRLARGIADAGAPPPPTMAQNVPNISPTPITSDLFPAATRVCELVILNIPRPITSDPYQEQDFALSLRVADKEIKTGTVTFSTRKLLDRILAAMGVLSEDTLHSLLKSLFSATNSLEVLLRGGKELFSAIIIESGLEAHFTAVFEDDSPVRLVVIIPSIREELHFLPWEWLPRPGYKELLLSESRYSIVRSKPVLREVLVQPISPPIRIMGLFPNVPLGARDVSDSSLKELEQLGRAGFLFHSLVHEDASVARVKEELDKFRPQIVHFEGHVSASGEENAAVRILFSNLTSIEPVGPPEFESLLKDHKVQLLVLGRNETNRVYGNAGPILASRVVRMAVPTVLAPIRAVDEVTATTFTTEFYRAFLRGGTVEQALFIARQKVESNGGDWTPFALFSDPWVLDDFKALPLTL